jgi:hypothetical protein
MGVSFGDIVGDVRPDNEERPEPAEPKAEPSTQIDPITLRREAERLNRRDARLRAT